MKVNFSSNRSSRIKKKKNISKHGFEVFRYKRTTMKDLLKHQIYRNNSKGTKQTIRKNMSKKNRQKHDNKKSTTRHNNLQNYTEN